MKHFVHTALCLAAFLIARTALAQAVDKPAHPFIRTTGDATVSVPPDRAKLTIGVTTQGTTAQTAGAQNATKTDAMVAALRKSLGPSADIHTSGYALSPNFRNPKDGGQPVLAGYTASNTVEVTTDDLPNLGKLIDAATHAGANNVQGVDFQLKDEEPVHAQALRDASRQARASADAIAAAMGLKVLRVLSVEEGSPQVIRPSMGAMSMTAANAENARTPIEAGKIQMEATVTLTVEVGP